MQTIHLGYKDYTVTDATYEKVVALVHTERICKVCEQPYTSDNPEALKKQMLILREAEEQPGLYRTT